MVPVEKELIKFFETFDINSIPKEERLKQYVDLSTIKQPLNKKNEVQ